MIPIFDLDDTLYLETAYVRSGFFAVAKYLEQRFGWSVNECFEFMLNTLKCEGRGVVFNRLLESKKALSRSRVQDCVKVYRHHYPSINLTPKTREIISRLGSKPYLVTDGHKIVQQKKVQALKLESLFKKIYITHRYGIQNAKPSTYCFELIKKIENCEWSDMFYVGDNPAKDFVNLKKRGVHTIRILSGEHSEVVAKKGFEADHRITSLDQLQSVLGKIFK